MLPMTMVHVLNVKKDIGLILITTFSGVQRHAQQTCILPSKIDGAYHATLDGTSVDLTAL